MHPLTLKNSCCFISYMCILLNIFIFFNKLSISVYYYGLREDIVTSPILLLNIVLSKSRSTREMLRNRWLTILESCNLRLPLFHSYFDRLCHLFKMKNTTMSILSSCGTQLRTSLRLWCHTLMHSFFFLNRL